MSTKTKLFGAGAVAILAVVAVVLITRGDDSGSSDVVAPPPPGSLVEPVPAGQPSPERPADAGPAVQLLPDGGAPPAPAHVSRFPQPPNPAAYRPARYITYSADEVSLDGSADNSNWALRRILEITQASPRQADQVRALWRKHEDGRRELWEKAFDRRSGPRILDEQGVRALDTTFETDLINQVFDEDQAQRFLLEVPPKGTPPPLPRLWTPEERMQHTPSE